MIRGRAPAEARTAVEIIADCRKVLAVARFGIKTGSVQHEEEDQLRLTLAFLFSVSIFATFEDRLIQKVDRAKYGAWMRSFQFVEWASLPPKPNRLTTFILNCKTVRNSIMHGALFKLDSKSVVIGSHTSQSSSTGMVFSRTLNLKNGPPEYIGKPVEEICENLLSRMAVFLEDAERSVL